MDASVAESAVMLTNYVFPNDLHVHWSMMIVLYPYITGLVDGAFIIAALYYLFGVEPLKPVARFSLLFALAFLCCATLPLRSRTDIPQMDYNTWPNSGIGRINPTAPWPTSPESCLPVPARRQRPRAMFVKGTSSRR